MRLDELSEQQKNKIIQWRDFLEDRILNVYSRIDDANNMLRDLQDYSVMGVGAIGFRISGPALIEHYQTEKKMLMGFRNQLYDILPELKPSESRN